MKRRVILVTLASLLMLGCSYRTYQSYVPEETPKSEPYVNYPKEPYPGYPYERYPYEVQAEKDFLYRKAKVLRKSAIALVGDAMFTWKNVRPNTMIGSLYYLGVQNEVIYLQYREVRKRLRQKVGLGIVKPPSEQKVTNHQYDLKVSTVFYFSRFRVEVLSATRERIQFHVFSGN